MAYVISAVRNLEDLSVPYQLLSKYSFSFDEPSKCPDKFKMELTGTKPNKALRIPYKHIKLDLGSWYYARENPEQKNFDGVVCMGDEDNAVVELHPGETLSVEDIDLMYNNAESTRMLMQSISPRLSSGNYWVSTPNVSAFNCSKHGNLFGEEWFKNNFTFVFFKDSKTVDITFIGKERANGSLRMVALSLPPDISYFIATGSRATYIYRAVAEIQPTEMTPLVHAPLKSECDCDCTESTKSTVLPPATPPAWLPMYCEPRTADEKSKEKGDRACFPSSALVQLRDGRKISIDALNIGDEVLCEEGQYSHVVMFTHASNITNHSFITLHTLRGYKLSLSAGHLLPTNKAIKRADAVQFGDVVTDYDGQADAVYRIEHTYAQGLYNPQTLAGTIVVDGVVTSCYTSEIAHGAAHAMLAPFRVTFASTRLTPPRTMCAHGCPFLLDSWRSFSLKLPRGLDTLFGGSSILFRENRHRNSI